MIENFRIRQIGTLFSEGYAARGPVFLSERRARRDAIFAERAFEKLERRLLCWLRALHPSKLPLFLGELRALCTGERRSLPRLPDPAQAAPGPAGLCGPVTDMAADILAEGYARGLHLGAGPAGLRWWSPEQRLVVDPRDFRLPTDVAGDGDPDIRFDVDFEATLLACERARSTSSRHFLMPPGGIAALCKLSDRGFAHSFEVRDRAGTRIAGGYGVAVGRSVLTHDMFGPRGDALRGLRMLNRHLAHWGYEMHETLCPEDHAQMGFLPLARAAHAAALQVLSGGGHRQRWRIDPDLAACD